MPAMEPGDISLEMAAGGRGTEVSLSPNTLRTRTGRCCAGSPWSLRKTLVRSRVHGDRELIEEQQRWRHRRLRWPARNLIWPGSNKAWRPGVEKILQ